MDIFSDEKSTPNRLYFVWIGVENNRSQLQIKENVILFLKRTELEKCI